jgi:hypothetical protein
MTCEEVPETVFSMFYPKYLLSTTHSVVYRSSNSLLKLQEGVCVWFIFVIELGGSN